MKNLLEAMHSLKLENKLTVQKLYDDMNKYSLDTEYREAFTKAIKKFKYKDEDEINPEQAKNIINFIKKEVGKDDYQIDEFMDFAKYYLKENKEKPDRETIKGLLELGAIDDPDYYESLSDKEKEELVDYWTEHYNDDLEESKSLNEERYYYGEIENLKSKLQKIMGQISETMEYINKLTGNENGEYEYDKEQFEILDHQTIVLQNIGNDVGKVYTDLEKAFKNRIRNLTPDEKQEIQRRINNGEI